MARTRHAAAGAAVAGAGLFVGALVAVSIGALGPGSVDPRTVVAAHAAVLAHPTLLSLARDATDLGIPIVVDVVAAVGALVLWLIGRRRAAAYLLVVRVAAQVTESVVKVLVGRSRPVLAHPVAHATGYSFPSGHATGAASVYLPLAVVAWAVLRRGALRGVVAAVAVLLCLAVAASRVLLGVHYPSDVVGGLALGAGLTAVVTPLLGRTWTDRSA